VVRVYYSEKIVRLPCYQPNDRKRVVAPSRPTRAEMGLPDHAFVYCCLNGMQKTTARTYQR
jgi:predicted O-linked N-acetylglucosamine transferase (SPINDLY family)